MTTSIRSLRAPSALLTLGLLALAPVAAAQPAPPTATGTEAPPPAPPTATGTEAPPPAPPAATGTETPPPAPPAAWPAPPAAWPAPPEGAYPATDPGAPPPGAPPWYQGEPARPAPPVWARSSDTGGPASGAPADAPEPAEPAPRDIAHLVQPELGLRLLWISHDGFEPYGTRDVNALAALALGVMFYPLRVGAFALGVGPEYDVGRRAGTVRGDKAVLVVHRLGVPIVADVALIRHIHLFSRIAPAANYLHGAITDTAIDRSLVANGWTWGFDVSGGVTALLGTVGAADAPDLAFWASLEGGYAFAGEVELTYAPASDDDDPRSFGAVALPPVAPAGALSRIGVGVSF